MIDIEQIRKKTEAFRIAAKAKRIALDIDQLLGVDAERRALEAEVERLRERRNRLSEFVARGADLREKNIEESRAVGLELVSREAALSSVDNQFAHLMALVPSLPEPDVPGGESDDDNVEIRRWGAPQEKSFALKDHMELAALHGMVDFAGARNIAGSRAYALTGTGALLEMAVLRFALDRLLDKGFQPVLPPLLVKYEAMFGTGYFPLGQEESYELNRDKLFLTGTSEVGLVSLQMNKTFDAGQLPLRYVGISPCFRREAGAAGRDTRGLYRVHQFQKVEQVLLCANDPEVSRREHFELLGHAEEIVQALELPYRVVAVCTGEMGQGQVRKHDIETWMPGRGAYGETHSCSSFHDFQARRLSIRYREGKGRKMFVHTLNNTALASPRILIALLENHQNEDGSIRIPRALRSYLGGLDLLEPL